MYNCISYLWASLAQNKINSSTIIKKLAKRKYPGHDLIINQIIKSLPAKTIIFLAHIYNATLCLSYFPTTWKSSVIVTILKPGKPPEHPSSYWSISLLPVLGKILEKTLLKRLSHITTENKNIPTSNSDFTQTTPQSTSYTGSRTQSQLL